MRTTYSASFIANNLYSGFLYQDFRIFPADADQAPVLIWHLEQTQQRLKGFAEIGKEGCFFCDDQRGRSNGGQEAQDFWNYFQTVFQTNVKEIAPSFPVGIAEMFLPVLLIKNNVDMIHPGARYVVVAVSIVQIIFFSETVVVMMATKLPLKLRELIIVFIERTILGIIFASLFARILGFL